MRLEISCENNIDLTVQVLNVLKSYDIELNDIEINKDNGLFVDVSNVEFSLLQKIMPHLRKIPEINDVKTTSFMPLQLERNQFKALLKSFDEPVFTTDINGRVINYNGSVANLLDMPDLQIRQLYIDDLIHNVNISKWLNSKKPKQSYTENIQFLQKDYIAKVDPIFVPDGDREMLIGSVIVLNSERSLSVNHNVLRKTYSGGFEHLVANSAKMQALVDHAKRVSKLDDNILITGETGTGKETIAKACHDNSSRHDGEFVVFNCAAKDDSLAEAELFGYINIDDSEQGTYGLFAQALGGTLVLADISELSTTMQTKLLHVLEYGTYYRAGSKHLEYVDCRIICTSSKDLTESIQNNTFNEALYYRLNELSLYIPSLRERKADIVELANLLIKQHAKKLGIEQPILSKTCIEYVQSYPWPGNIRQLKNALYRAIALSDKPEISKECINLPSLNGNLTLIDEDFDGTLEQEVKRFEKNMLKRLYPSYPSTRQLARKLGLSHTAIANKLREYGISKHTVRF